MQNDRPSCIRLISLILFTSGILMLIILSAGCISIAKTTVSDAIIPPPTPTTAPTEAPTPTPTPTPAPTQPPPPPLSPQQFRNLYGGYLMGEWHTFTKDLSGSENLSVSATVYGWRTEKIVNWYSPSWGRYLLTAPPENTKFLFVFAHVFCDDGSAKIYGFERDNFVIQIDNKTYASSEDHLHPQFRIRELDEVWDLRHIRTIQPYGYVVTYDIDGNPVAHPIGYITPGKSNGWDGYIVFTVPETTDPRDVRVLADFRKIGGSVWWELDMEDTTKK